MIRAGLKLGILRRRRTAVPTRARRSRQEGPNQEWKPQVEADAPGFDVPSKPHGPRMWLRIRGEEKDAVEHLSMADLTHDDGLQANLKVLYQEFGYHQVDAVEDTAEHCWNYRRTFRQVKRRLRL